MNTVERLPFEDQVVGQQFVFAGTTYEVTGIDTSRPKRPVVARRVRDDKVFNLPWEVVRDQVTF